MADLDFDIESVDGEETFDIDGIRGPRGYKGDKGDAGNGIVDISVSGANLIITLEDGSSYSVPVSQGPKGDKVPPLVGG